MSTSIRTARLLLATTCLLLAFAHSSIVECQTAIGAEKTGATRQDQGAQPAPPVSTDARNDEDGNPAKDEQPVSQIQMDGFVQLINNHRCVGGSFRETGNPDKVDVIPAINYSKLMGIRSDEVETMCSICDQTDNKLFENDRAWQTFHDAYLHDHDDFTAKNIPPELSARANEWGLQRTRIYEEGVAELRQALGEESFRKMAAWVEKSERYQMRLQTEATLRAAQREADKMNRTDSKPKPTQSEGDPASEPTPVVPQ